MTLKWIAFHVLVGCVVIASPAGPAAAQPGTESQDGLEFRTWTDSTGQYRTEAAMIKFEGGQVYLQLADGSSRTVPVGKLSGADRRYVREELARRAAGGGRPSPVMSGQAADWPGWRGANRDGKSPDVGLLKAWPPGGPELLWKVDSVGRGYSNVAVTGGTVYTTGHVGDTLTLFAFDLDGRLKWNTAHGVGFTKSYPGSRATPMIDGRNLYLMSGGGLLICYNTADGGVRWSVSMQSLGGKTPGWGYSESVLIHNDLVIVTPGGSNCIVALDKNSGRPAWSSRGFSAGAQYGSCISVTHGRTTMIVAGTAKGIVAVDAKDGRLLWSNDFSADNTANCPTPAAADGYVFWANGYGRGGICLQLSDAGGRGAAREAWRTKDMDCTLGGYFIHQGHVYGNHAEGWVCLDLASGEKRWQARGVGRGSVCYADGMMYLLAENGGRAALATCSPEGLEIRGELTVEGRDKSWAHPVVIGGRLYIRYATNLYCFDVREK